jgi:hypothetical protein
MPTLLETERAMFRAIVFKEPNDVAPHIAGGAFSPAERLDIYRNTFLSSLTAALRISYPAVHRLVGEEFFDGAAQCFIQAHPPQTAYLNAYGAGLADFLARFPAAASLPYLADVARLEWAVNLALHAEDAIPLDADALASIADVPPERLILTPHPSIGLLRLDHPAEAIWRSVLAEDDSALRAIDLSAGPEWLLVERNANGVEVSPLAETEWRFAASLCAHETFAKSVETTPAADVVCLFARHLAAGRFIGFRLAEDRPAAPLENAP